MKKLYLLFAAFITFSLLFGQTQHWYFNYNNGTMDEEAADIVYDDDGFIYVAGHETDEVDYDILVVKLNKSGEQQWAYLYEGEESRGAQTTEIKMGPDGNIYVCGSTANAADKDKFMVLSLDPQGTLRWDFIFDETGNYYSYANSIAFGPNGTVYAAGEADYNFFVVAINSADGTEKWNFWFDGSCPSNLCDDVAKTICTGSDGTVYAAGYTRASESVQMVISALSPDGDEQWRYTHPSLNVGNSQATDIIQGADGRIYASCYVTEDMGVICLNTDGEKQWIRTVDGPGSEPYYGEYAYEVLFGIDNYVYVVGRTGGRDEIVDTDLDVTVLKIDLDGEVDWFYRYEGFYGDYDIGFQIVQTADTNLHVAAYTCGLLAEANLISLHHKTGRNLGIVRYLGPEISMDVAYALDKDENGMIYLTGYDYEASDGRDLYVWKIDPPRNTDGYYSLQDYKSSGRGEAIIETPDSCYVIAGRQGTTSSYTTYGMRLLKTDINGDTLWKRYIGGTDEDGAYNVLLCPDNGFLITGYTKSYGSGGKDVYIVKTDGSGLVEWEKVYGFESDEEAFTAALAPDGGYLIGATSTHKTVEGDIWLLKLNAACDTLWTKWYGGEKRDEVNEIYPTVDDNFILAGSIGHPEGVGYITNVYVMKLDQNGDTLWTREFGTNDYYDTGEDIYVNDDGTYLLAGYHHWRNWLAKLDANGDTLWTRSYGDDHAIGFTSIARKKDGNFVMTNGRNNVSMLCVATVDPDGNMVIADTVQWSPEINYAASQAEGYDVCANAFGGYMVTGKGKPSGENIGTWNIILYRKGGTLTPLPPLGIDEFPLISSGHNSLPLDVFPNPFSHFTTFQLESTEPGIAEMQISDITGRVVYKVEAVRIQKGQTQISWSVDTLPGGIYFCRVQSGNKIYTAKIIHLQ